MVHLAYNGTERRKMPSPLKIELFTRYHSETPCKVCPKQSAACPETPQSIRADCIQNAGTNRARTVSRYHAGAPGNSLTGSRTAGTDTDRAGMIQRHAIQRRPIPNGTGADHQTVPTESARNDHAEPEQLFTVSQRRIFRGSPVRGAQPVHISPVAMQGSAFCGFSALISANCAKC